VLTLVVLCMLARAGYRRRQQAHRRRRLWAEVDALEQRHMGDSDSALAAALHQLLRRAARLIDPEAATQTGSAWRNTLERLQVSEPTVSQLVQLDAALYRPAGTFDRAGVIVAVRQWLAALAASDAMLRRIPRHRSGA
jgi:hypothetical protein